MQNDLKTSTRFLSDDPQGDWPEDFAHENGNYTCRCCECDKIFLGHKRRNVCKVCSKGRICAGDAKTTMTPNEINRAIALHCGLKENQSPAGPYWYNADHPQCQDGTVLWELPDYSGDLNAMAEAESTLTTDREQNAYQSNIAEVCYANYERRNNQVVFNQLTATAEDRSEAFLLTVGLWK